MFYYCDGITLPIEHDTWWDMVNVSYIYDTLIDESDYGLEQQYCYYHTVALPMLNLFKSEIEKIINDDETKSRIVVYSAHGSTLMHLLGGMRIWDFEPFSNAEMVTLEIYSTNMENEYIIDNEIEWLFRFTRKGEILLYPECDYVNNTNDELCDLRVLFDNEFNDVVSIREYENDICMKILDDKRCGYIKSQDTNNNDNKEDDENVLLDWESSTFVIAIIIGFVGGVFLSYIVYQCDKWKALRDENKTLWKGQEESELADYQTYPKTM